MKKIILFLSVLMLMFWLSPKAQAETGYLYVGDKKLKSALLPEGMKRDVSNLDFIVGYYYYKDSSNKYKSEDFFILGNNLKLTKSGEVLDGNDFVQWQGSYEYSDVDLEKGYRGMRHKVFSTNVFKLGGYGGGSGYAVVYQKGVEPSEDGKEVVSEYGMKRIPEDIATQLADSINKKLEKEDYKSFKSVKGFSQQSTFKNQEENFDLTEFLTAPLELLKKLLIPGEDKLKDFTKETGDRIKRFLGFEVVTDWAEFGVSGQGTLDLRSVEYRNGSTYYHMGHLMTRDFFSVLNEGRFGPAIAALRFITSFGIDFALLKAQIRIMRRYFG